MTSSQSSIVNAPLDAVFAWHTRPGAITRLTPPWLPVTVAAEAASLRDGRAVLALPGGLSWDAQHDPGPMTRRTGSRTTWPRCHYAPA